MADNRKINVLHTLSVGNLTGAAQPFLILAREFLQNDDINLSVAVPLSHGNISVRLKDEGLNVIQDVDLSPRGIVISKIKQAVQLSRVIDSLKIDVLHCHLSHDHWVGSMAVKLSKRKIPIVRTIHNSRMTIGRLSYKALYKIMCDRLICVSSMHKNAIVRNFKINPEYISVIRASVETDRFTPEINSLNVRKFIEKYSIGTGETVIGCVARFKEGRGHEELVGAFKRIKEIVPCSKLMLVGKGELVGKIKSLVNDNNLGNSVVFTGYLKEELPVAYKVMSAAVVLAEGNDGSMRTVLEAMSSGTPVIALSKGAVSEIIKHGESGYIADNMEELISLTENIIKNKEASGKMRNALRERTIDLFAVQREVREHAEIYKEIMEVQLP